MSNLITRNVERILRDYFEDLELQGGTGLVRKGFTQVPADEIVQTYVGTSFTLGDYAVSPCKPCEGYLPLEFRTALEIEARTRIDSGLITKPIALIQVGSLRDLALGQASMLYLTRSKNDKDLLTHFEEEDLTYFQMSDLLGRLVKKINSYRRDNIYLMDFSPKDVRVHSGSGAQESRDYFPRLVKTRSVEFKDALVGDLTKVRSLEEKQTAKFREDYTPFIGSQLLDWCLERLNDRRW